MENVESRNRLWLTIYGSATRQMFLHLVERDDADARLEGLGGDVFQAALGRDAEDDLLARLEEADRGPGAQPDAGSGAERPGEVGDLGDAQAGAGPWGAAG